MKQLTPSATVTINAIAGEKRRNGETVYNFAAGDPVLPNHPCITNRAIKWADSGICPYPPVEGLYELRKLASEWVNTSCGLDYNPEHTLVTCGGKYALFSILYSLLDSQAEVLIPAPYWVSYPDVVKMAGAHPKVIYTKNENGWKLQPEDIINNISKRTKALILNNACNPTGVLYTKNEVEALLATAAKFGLLVISDEVYSGLVYSEQQYVSCGSFSQYRDRVLIVQSCSKNFGMTGWRIGFVFAEEHFIKRLSILQGQSTTGVSLCSQWAAVGALENAAEVNLYVKSAMLKRRNAFLRTFKQLLGIPLQIDSALYAFVPLSCFDVPKEVGSVSFCEHLISTSNVAVVPGAAFGVDDHVRFAFSEEETTIIGGLNQIMTKL